jgi:hypothetical protein
VYSSADPWIFTAYGIAPASARARIAGPITRWFTRAASGPGGGGDIADRGDVRGEVALDLAVGQLREGPGVESRVAVSHIERQQPADVGQVRGAADGLAHDIDVQPPAAAVAHGIHEVELRGVGLLAQQVHFVAEPDQCPGQLRVVDIASGPAQQVAMENQHPQSHHAPGECPRQPAVAGQACLRFRDTKYSVYYI